MLGICRGAQVLNVAAGGTLVQDVPVDRHADRAHGRVDPRSSTTRPAAATRSRCCRERGWPTGWAPGKHVVNSYHHQAVDRLGDGLRTAAVAPDGTIEATESTNGSYAVGLQWHNEFHMRADERYARPLQALVERRARVGRRGANARPRVRPGDSYLAPACCSFSQPP